MDKFDTTKFRQNLSTLIESNAMNTTQFSYKLGIPPMTIFRYMSGDRVPSIEYAVKIARYFHVSVDWLLGVQDDPQSITEPSEFAAMYMLASNDDKAVIRSLLVKYADSGMSYLDKIRFAETFSTLGGYNKMDVINLMTRFEKIPGAYCRIMPVLFSVRFSPDPYKDAAIVTMSVEGDKARIIVCPGRIRICLTANDMFPNEANTLLEQFKPFLNTKESKYVPYENDMAKYYFDIPKVIENMDEFVGYIAQFIQDIK